MPPDCGMLVKLTGTTWAQYYPKTQGQMDCNPSYVIHITGSAQGTTLGADRVSTKFLDASVIKPTA